MHCAGRCNFGDSCKFSHATTAAGAGVSPYGVYKGPGMLHMYRARQGERHYHPGHIYLEIPRKTYFYLFFLIFGVILIKYLSFWSK